MTIFLVMNPDQSYPYEYDAKENQKQNSSNAFFPSAEHQLKNLLTSKKKCHLFRPGMKKTHITLSGFILYFPK